MKKIILSAWCFLGLLVLASTSVAQPEDNDHRRDYEEAEALREDEDYQAAITAYTLALEGDPGNGLYYTRRGQVHQILDDTEAALADFDRAIEGGYSPAYADRAGIYFAQERYEVAVDDAVMAAQGTSSAFLQNDFADWGPDLVEALGPEAVLEAANTALAVPDLRKAGIFHMWRADAYNELGQREDALTEYRAAADDLVYIPPRVLPVLGMVMLLHPLSWLLGVLYLMSVGAWVWIIRRKQRTYMAFWWGLSILVAIIGFAGIFALFAIESFSLAIMSLLVLVVLLILVLFPAIAAAIIKNLRDIARFADAQRIIKRVEPSIEAKTQQNQPHIALGMIVASIILLTPIIVIAFLVISTPFDPLWDAYSTLTDNVRQLFAGLPDWVGDTAVDVLPLVIILLPIGVFYLGASVVRLFRADADARNDRLRRLGRDSLGYVGFTIGVILYFVLENFSPGAGLLVIFAGVALANWIARRFKAQHANPIWEPLREGDLARAAAAAEDTQTDNERAAARDALIALHFWHGNYATVEEHLREALRKTTDLHTQLGYLDALGRVLDAQGQHAEADQAFAALVEIDSRASDTAGHALHHLRTDAAHAATICRRGIGLGDDGKPHHAQCLEIGALTELYAVCALAEATLGNPKQAQNDLQAALTKAEHNIEQAIVHAYAAAIYRHVDDSGEAATHAQKQAVLAPDLIVFTG